MRISAILGLSLLLSCCSKPQAVQSTVSLDPPNAKLGATVRLRVVPAPENWSGQITVMNATVVHVDSGNPSFALTSRNGFTENGNTDLFVTLVDPKGYEIPLTNRGRLVLQVIQSSVTVEPSSEEVSPTGGSGAIHVTAADNYRWSAASLPDWVEITPATQGSGPAIIQYKAAPNTTGQARTAHIGLGDAVLEIIQPAQRSSGFKPFRTAGDTSKKTRDLKDKSNRGEPASKSK